MQYKQEIVLTDSFKGAITTNGKEIRKNQFYRVNFIMIKQDHSLYWFLKIILFECLP